MKKKKRTRNKIKMVMKVTGSRMKNQTQVLAKINLMTLKIVKMSRTMIMTDFLQAVKTIPHKALRQCRRIFPLTQMLIRVSKTLT